MISLPLRHFLQCTTDQTTKHKHHRLEEVIFYSQLRLARRLTERLATLARDRLGSLLDDVINDVDEDAQLFTHIIDETVLFQMEMDNGETD